MFEPWITWSLICCWAKVGEAAVAFVDCANSTTQSAVSLFTTLVVAYQTMSTRPALPASIHGNKLVL